MTPDGPREDGPPEEAVGARGMNRQRKPQAEPQPDPQTASTKANSSVPSAGVVWVRISPSQVMRTVVIALLSAAAVLGAFFLLWQVRTSSAGSSSPCFWRRCSTRRSTGSSGATV